MKYLAFLVVLSLTAPSVFAEDSTTKIGTPPLDIAKVISQTPDDGSCGMELMHLVYQDSHGLVHTLDYMIVGSGCSNG
ncbi:DUF2790 domain-containing protein [Pseudomonas petrae]